MKYKNIDRTILIKEIPYTIRYLESIDISLQNIGVELAIRDTDHHYASIRLEFPCINMEKENAINNQINDYLSNHCCKCGCYDIVKQQNDDYSWPLKCICEECSVKESGFYKYIIYQIRKQSINPAYRAKHVKIKLKTDNGKFVYRFADEIRFVDDSFVIRNVYNPNINDKVKFVGLDLGIRDINDERVYEGDILLAENSEGFRFWGMVKKEKSGWKHLSVSNPKWEDYSLLHGWGNFPSPLSHAIKFRIIGSVGIIKDFDGEEVSDGHYMRWCKENENLDIRSLQL